MVRQLDENTVNCQGEFFAMIPSWHADSKHDPRLGFTTNHQKWNVIFGRVFF